MSIKCIRHPRGPVPPFGHPFLNRLAGFNAVSESDLVTVTATKAEYKKDGSQGGEGGSASEIQEMGDDGVRP